MGNQPSRAQVIEIKKVEIVRKPQDNTDRSKRRPEDDSAKKKDQKDADERKPPEKGPPAKGEPPSKAEPLAKAVPPAKTEPPAKAEPLAKTKPTTEKRKDKKKKKRKRESEEEKPEERPPSSPKPFPKTSETKPDTQPKMKPDTQPKMKPDTQPKMKPPDTQPKMKPDSQPKMKPDKQPKMKPDSQPKMKPDKQPKMKPDKYESATEIAADTDDIPKKENTIKKISRLIGIPQMSPKNFFVMFILWSLRFFIPWVNTWWNFNKYILSDPAHLDALESYLFMQEIIAFVVICILCVLVSVFADVFNLKYFLYLFFIALFILCPITGLVAINILWARGYNKPQYHKYSPMTYVLMYWAKSIPNIAYPLEFCCFFTQVDNMSREAHYNYAAIFVFLDSLNWLICFYVVPGECPTLQWTLASVWIAIGVVIHTVFLLSCFFIMWVKPANKVLNRSPFVLKVVRFINGMLTKLKMTSCLIDETPRETKLDNFSKKATPFMKKMKLILFGLILVPIIFSSFVIAIMHRLELDEDWDKHEFSGASSMFMFGRVIGVVLIALTLFLLRRNKKIKFLNKISATRPDVLALGLPHIIIILALLVIAGRFGSLLSLKEGDVMIGPIPDDDGSVIEFYNGDFRNRTVCVYSEKFRAVKVGPRKRETRKPSDPGVTKFEVTVSLAPRTTPAVLTHEILAFAPKSLITYVITLNSSEATATDLEA